PAASPIEAEPERIRTLAACTGPEPRAASRMVRAEALQAAANRGSPAVPVTMRTCEAGADCAYAARGAPPNCNDTTTTGITHHQFRPTSCDFLPNLSPTRIRVLITPTLAICDNPTPRSTARAEPAAPPVRPTSPCAPASSYHSTRI